MARRLICETKLLAVSVALRGSAGSAEHVYVWAQVGVGPRCRQSQVVS